MVAILCISALPLYIFSTEPLSSLTYFKVLNICIFFWLKFILGCAKFLLRIAHFAYPQRIPLISPYLAAAEHFGTFSSKFTFELNASPLDMSCGDRFLLCPLWWGQWVLSFLTGSSLFSWWFFIMALQKSCWPHCYCVLICSCMC